MSWLKSSGNCYNTDSFFAVHGGPDDYLEQYMYAPTFPIGISQNLFLCGHTHIQVYLNENGKQFCNPGSVGQPRDSDPKAAFAILHSNKTIENRRVEYNIQETAAACKDAGYDSRFYSGLFSGEPIKSMKGSVS